MHAYDERNYEVEFINEEGKTTALCPLSAEQFIVVWQAKTKRWVPLAGHVAALVSHLLTEHDIAPGDLARVKQLIAAHEARARKENDDGTIGSPRHFRPRTGLSCLA